MMGDLTRRKVPEREEVLLSATACWSLPKDMCNGTFVSHADNGVKDTDEQAGCLLRYLPAFSSKPYRRDMFGAWISAFPVMGCSDCCSAKSSFYREATFHLFSGADDRG